VVVASKKTQFLSVALFSSALVVACGSDNSSTPDMDSGPAGADAGSEAGTDGDAASLADAAGSVGDAAPGSDGQAPGDAASNAEAARPLDASSASPTVFLILLENHNWSSIKGSASAPYINGLLATGAHAEQYFNPPGIHPSEPNYLWLEAGSNFGILNDNDPSTNHQSSTGHLSTLLRAANISWKAYQEDIAGDTCPLTAVARYAPKHDPFVFFDDSTGTNNQNDPYCIAHNRPYAPEFANDLLAGTVANYNFITPNLCSDMHDTCAPTNDSIKQGDDWLSREVPKILASAAYGRGAYVFITWDEAEGGIDGPIGMIALSKNAKVGYSGSVHYTHSSTLRTVEEIFGVTPFLGDAANATDLADLFTSFP
jgi:phosphatidylinositol-3-phosphatase